MIFYYINAMTVFLEFTGGIEAWEAASKKDRLRPGQCVYLSLSEVDLTCS